MQDTQRPEPISHEGYRLKVGPIAQRISAEVGGVVIADSADVLVMRETGYPPVYYFPREDVAMEHLVESELRTHCPFKGNASYWSIKIGDQLIEDVAWSYENPFDEAVAVKDYIAIYWSKIDRWLADGKAMPEPQRAAHDEANPLVAWLVDQAWRSTSIPEMLTAFSEALRDSGYPLWRTRFLIQTLNPLLFARGYTWQLGVEGIEEFQATHAGLSAPKYQESPFAAIINGEGGIRRRLEGPGARIDFPVLADLVAEGATDYVAMPMRFSDGQINILVLVSDQPSGFSTEQLGKLYKVLANLSRLLEAHAQRSSSQTLLRTYLGHGAGDMVMDGLVKRGDAEEVLAVILMSDLRDSTLLAEQLPQSDYLAALNDYFDCVAGAVVDNGGDVLKFIGDAVLAIFPINGASGVQCAAYGQAVTATTDALQRLAVINTEREANDLPALQFGTALHCDTLTFGNIGTPGRLDFTVVGAGVNKTARIATLCKDLTCPVIVSEAVAKEVTAPLTSLGVHELRGFEGSVELFALDQAQLG